MDALQNKINLMEEYELLVENWDRGDLSVPSFEQWAYMAEKSEYLRHVQHRVNKDALKLKAIEAFVIQLGKCNLSLVKKSGRVSEAGGYESLKLALELLNHLEIDSRYTKRLEDLFDYYIQDPAKVIDWQQFGILPEAQNSMRAVLEQVMQEMEKGYATSLISKERAIGIAEGATALMVQSGACQPEYAVSLVENIRSKLSTSSTPVWEVLNRRIKRKK
ncbi:hypothetical protein ACO0LB_11510 [Undibacterium sp. SXout7W]|uniref:hypothetical protein n=1 Tax=Undibacterium sp. SXout7W TaxID=3413049 RepID=UPI003BF1AE2E